LTPSTAGFSPEVIAVIIGNDEAELVDAVLSARAETLLIRSRDMAALSVFMALLFEWSKEAEPNEPGWV
jgi:hypothetical protein